MKKEIKYGDHILDSEGYECRVESLVIDIDTEEILGVNVHYLGDENNIRLLRVEGKEWFKKRI